MPGHRQKADAECKLLFPEVPSHVSSVFKEGAGQVCCRDSVLAGHACVEKPKKAKTRGIGKNLVVVAQTGRRDAANSIVGLLEGSAGEGRCGWEGAVSRDLGRQNCSAFSLPFETLSLTMHKEIWVGRTCQSWKNCIEIPLQKDKLLLACFGVTALCALGCKS